MHPLESEIKVNCQKSVTNKEMVSSENETKLANGPKSELKLEPKVRIKAGTKR